MADDDDEIPAIVIDNGSYMCRAGFAGEDAPDCVFPAVVGTPVYTVGKSRKDFYIGDEAQKRRGLLSLKYPVERGIVTDWDDMEKIWRHVFSDELNVDSKDHPVLMTEPPLNPKCNREKLTEVMFEAFNVPAFHVCIQGVLAVYASGRGSCIVIEIGEGATHILTIYEGYTILHAIERLDLAGKDLNQYLARLLEKRGYTFSTSAELETVRDIKEKLCYCVEDYNHATSQKEKIYTLPDGQEITIGNECFQCPEALFQPSLVGVSSDGVHKLLYRSLMTNDIDTRRDVFCNIIPSGGSTLFPGFVNRLRKEMMSLIPPTKRLKVLDFPERKYSVWIGGSIIASLSTFQYQWITKEEYEENGPAFVNRRCCPVIA